MKISELFQDYKDNRPIKVTVDVPVANAVSVFGTITAIKFHDTGLPKCILVKFEGSFHATPFWYKNAPNWFKKEDPGQRYIDELKLLK